jgi:hypothetical protein
MGRDAETQLATRLWREGFDDAMGYACVELQRRGQPEDAVVVLHIEEGGDEGAPPRILDARPWIGPRADVREIVPDVPAAILAEIDATPGDRFPVLLWSTFRDGRAPAGEVLAFARVDEARDAVLARRHADRLQAARNVARAMVPPDRPLLCGILPETVGRTSGPITCLQCHDPTPDVGAVLLDSARQAREFGHLSEPIAVALLVPLCGPCAQRYRTAPSSFAGAALDHAIERFWDGGVDARLLGTTEDSHAFPWLQSLMERIRAGEDLEDAP